MHFKVGSNFSKLLSLKYLKSRPLGFIRLSTKKCGLMVRGKFSSSNNLLTNHNIEQQLALLSYHVIIGNICRMKKCRSQYRSMMRRKARRKPNGHNFRKRNFKNRFKIFITDQFRDFEEVRELKKVPYFNSRHDSPLWIDD